MLEGSWKQNATTVVASVMSLEVVNNWRSVLQINHLEKDLDMNFILFQQKYVTITIFEWLVSTWHMCLSEISEKKHLKLRDYLNQIQGPLAALNALQRFAFPCALATRQHDCKSWLSALYPIYHLTPEIGHL